MRPSRLSGLRRELQSRHGAVTLVPTRTVFMGTEEHRGKKSASNLHREVSEIR